MKSINQLTFSLALLLFTTSSNAGFFGLEPGWPRIVDNSTQINSRYEGITAYFTAENKQKGIKGNREKGKLTRINNINSRAPYFKQSKNTPRSYFSNIEFNTWANIRLDSGTTLLDGAFEIFGSIELNGLAYEGLAFSASLIDVAWDEYTIAFKTESDHQGYLCDIGFCSFNNELLSFNLTSGTFDGDFSKNFELGAQTVATVPVPAAVWLFASAILGLGGITRLNRKQTQLYNRVLN